jgi:O-antigen ligase
MGYRLRNGSQSASNGIGLVAALHGCSFSANDSPRVFLDCAADYPGRIGRLNLFRLHVPSNGRRDWARFAHGRIKSVGSELFAATLLLPLSLSFGGVLSSRTWPRRTLFLTGTGVIAFAVFLTMSRGALAAVAAITFVFLFRLRLNWRLLLPVVAAGAALLFMPQLFFERMKEASTRRMSGRQDIWQIGIHSLQSYGAFGAGLENFPKAFQRYAGTSHFYAGDQRSSHNIYLTASVEFGILGMLFLFGAVRSHLQAFPRPTKNILTSAKLVAFEAACWGMLIAGFSIDILWRKAFWFVWAISIGAMHVQRENEQLSEPVSR